jgi:putative phosphoserine phosphatase/1-acylglycerol-3-phosphate O-acyltransferase
MATAAIFDLDRTLIAGSSAEVFGAKLSDVGVSTPSVPGQSLLFKIYEKFGEDPVSMRLARQSARLFAGRKVADVEAAALLGADVLIGRVLPHARVEIEKHKADGTLLVLATTSPHDLVAPLAAALGFDTVISTRYRAVHGVYDGTIDGTYLWGQDKAAAVAEWAGQNAVDLTASWAYSDSFYDVPLLELVGNPVAVNPDIRMLAAARAKRWAVRDFDRPDGVPAVAGLEGQELAFPWLDPRLSIFADIELRGVDNLPDGPVIIAPNHRSYFDPLALGYLAAAANRPFRFLAKKQVLEAPVVGQLTAALGTISVDRGSGSCQPLDAAADALSGGEAVVILPQGTIPRGEDFFKAKLRGFTGAVRLAQQTGAPLLPVGIWGTEQVWPRNQRMPSVGVFGGRPQVSLNVGEPYKVTKRSKPRPATEKLMKKIQLLLPEEAQKDRTPTDEELAATFPAGQRPAAAPTA